MEWTKIVGVEHISYRFPQKEFVTVWNPLWFYYDAEKNIRYYITAENRCLLVSGGFLLMEIFTEEGYSPLKVDLTPNWTVACEKYTMTERKAEE